MSNEPIDVQDLRECSFDMVLHMSLSRGGHAYQYRCVEHPAWVYTKEKATRRDRYQAVHCVGDQDVYNLAEVAEELNRLRYDADYYEE